jgi:HEAT repeat protein/Na+/melibiose symporter-like transporter
MNQPQPLQQDEPTTLEKMRGLPWSMAGNASNIVFVKFTFFGSTFVLFLSELGLDKSQIGFLLSLLPYFGITALFAAPLVARMGFKRAFLTFWGLRQLATFGMLLTPLINARFGLQITFYYIAGLMAFFALFRAMGETAAMPWRQEYIPDAIRGKYAATDSIFTTIASFIAVIVSSQVIAYSAGLTGYLALFAVGGLAGLLGVWFYSFIPGGKPAPVRGDESSITSDFGSAIRDRNFLIFLAAGALINMATAPLASFLPLFMEEQIGISTSNVILLQVGALLGTLLFSFLWGWTADRYGSKPVLMTSVYLRILLPLLFLLTPRFAPWNLWYAMLVSILQGVIDIGWVISSGRMLFVGVVPPAKKSSYMALYYAWIGIVGGTSQLAGGWLVDASANLSGGQVLGVPVDAYTPLFLLSAGLPILAAFFFTAVRADANYGVGEFAGLFVRGNPVMALRSLVSYQFARNEAAMVAVTARLGESQSRLTEEELIEALLDPRYHVRMEAVVSIARMRPGERLIQAMVDILNGTELSLSAMAAWALGRMGDPAAIPYLRAALNSPYKSIRAQSIRALGALEDAEMGPVFLEQLRAEMEPGGDKGLQMAYASSLGKLGMTEAVDDLLKLLRTFENRGARLEVALSVARLHGEEHYFVHLTRQMRTDPGTATALALEGIRKQFMKKTDWDEELVDLGARCSDALAHNDIDQGAALLGGLLARLPLDSVFDPVSAAILRECAARLIQYGSGRMEYLALALHTLHVGRQS